MAPTVLVQTDSTLRFELRLEDAGVAVTEHVGPKIRSYLVPFDHLALAPVALTVWSKPRLWATLLLLGLATLMMIVDLKGGEVGEGAALFYAVLAAIALFAFARSRQHYLVFKGDPALVVLKASPTPEAVMAFLELVQDRRRRYVAEQYLLGTHESALVDALHKLESLRSKGSVSASEFDMLKADILSRAGQLRPSAPSPN